MAPAASAICKLFSMLCVFFLFCLLSSCSQETTDRPQAFTISACPDTITVGHLLTTDLGLRFNAPKDRFTVEMGQRDAPPPISVITLNGHAGVKLLVSPDPGDFRDLEMTYPTFSKTVEERAVQDNKGCDFGTDRWGHLENGERWRYVRFTTGDRVGYGPEFTNSMPPASSNWPNRWPNRAKM